MADPDRAVRTVTCACPEYRYEVCDVCQCVTAVEVVGRPGWSDLLRRSAQKTVLYRKLWRVLLVQNGERAREQRLLRGENERLQRAIDHHCVATERELELLRVQCARLRDAFVDATGYEPDLGLGELS